MDKKIMIICPSMWPNMRNWGETQRMYYLANYLAKRDWKVYTVSPWFEPKKDDKREQFYEAIFLGEHRVAPKAVIAKNGEKESLSRRIRHKVAKFANFVCDKMCGETPFVEVVKKRRWVADYRDQICETIKKKDVKTVIISAPSFSLFSLSKAIKKQCQNVKIVFDYRDPWYLWKQNNFSCCFEKRYLKKADAVVGFSKAFIEDMKKKYSLNSLKTEIIYNGYSGETWDRFREDAKSADEKYSERLVLSYTGMIYLADQKDNYRNINKLIDVVNATDGVELYLVGVVGQEKAEKKGNVHYIGNVSQEESFRYMEKSHVLLSIHDTKDHSQKYIICGKFYDYLKSGKYIWHIGDPQSLMSELIERYELGITSKNETSALSESIQLLKQKWEKDLLQLKKNEELVNYFNRDYQNERYRQFLEDHLF